MNIWSSLGARKWLSQFISLCRQPSHRLLVVTGGLDLSVIREAGFGIRKEEIIEIDSPEQLYLLDSDASNHILLMKTLICAARMSNIERGLQMTQTFCRQQSYQFLRPLCDVTFSDVAYWKAEGYSAESNPWIAEIAHDTAASLSKGILQCYCDIVDIFYALEKEHKDALPSASLCQERYMAHMRQAPAFENIHQWFARNRSMMLSRQKECESYWIILWSAGLAGKFNGRWELSPILLEGPKLCGERVRRIIEANNINIPPIYMAWVYYCEQKYNLGGVVHFPVDICNELQNIPDAEEDRSFSHSVRSLRNWLQHDTHLTESEYQDSYLSHRTCKTIISKLDKDGRMRSASA